MNQRGRGGEDWDLRQNEMAPAWLRCSVEPFDRGERAPKFPYSRYAVIETETDCLGVIQDETQRWGEAFRSGLSARLCNLIGLLNRSTRFQTTHTVIGSEDPKKIMGYEWATASLGVAITIMFRARRVRLEIDDHVQLVQWLCHVISSQAFEGHSTGWLLGVWPEVVLYENAGGGADVRGYGVEFRATAFANNESCCAERLSRLLDWITELLSRAAKERPLPVNRA